MSAAQQLWTDDPRYYGGAGNYEIPRVLYVGPTCPPPALLAQALSDPEDSIPSFRIQAMSDHDDADRNTPTISAPPPSEEPATSPVASERPAIAPPARTPDAAELGASAIASREPPPWWRDSFIGQELGRFADDARAIREGRERNHVEQMRKLDKVTTDMAELAREMDANYQLLQGEFKRFRDSSEAHDREQDGRIRAIEKSLEEIKAKMQGDAKRIVDLETMIAELKKANARQPAPAAPPAEPA